jgi:hypothetical protein
MRSTRPNLVPPDRWCALGGSVSSDNKNSLLMSFIDDVINATRFVITDLNSFVVQAHLVVVDVSIHVQVSGNSCTATKLNFIRGNNGLGSTPLHIDSRRFTSHDFVIPDVN